MGYTVKRHIFKDGKVILEDRIAYANGEFVSLDDFEIAMQKKKDEIVDLRKELRESGACITQLQHELSDVQKSADEYYNKCSDLNNLVAELESELEVKENLLKIKNGLCGNFDDLPSEPISVANMLINAKIEYEPTSLQKALFKTDGKCLADKYSDDDLEQIAEHLLVYCKHNMESEE